MKHAILAGLIMTTMFTTAYAQKSVHADVKTGEAKVADLKRNADIKKAFDVIESKGKLDKELVARIVKTIRSQDLGVRADNIELVINANPEVAIPIIVKALKVGDQTVLNIFDAAAGKADLNAETVNDVVMSLQFPLDKASMEAYKTDLQNSLIDPTQTSIAKSCATEFRKWGKEEYTKLSDEEILKLLRENCRKG